jgi:hypothetical protein
MLTATPSGGRFGNHARENAIYGRVTSKRVMRNRIVLGWLNRRYAFVRQEFCVKCSDDAIDRAAHDAQVGRRYRHLKSDELGRRWVEAVGATVARPGDESARLLQEDLCAEHQLRRIKPPYEQVSTVRERLVADVAAKLQELKLLKLPLVTQLQLHKPKPLEPKPLDGAFARDINAGVKVRHTHCPA